MESAAPVQVEPGMNKTSAQRKHLVPTVKTCPSRAKQEFRGTEAFGANGKMFPTGCSYVLGWNKTSAQRRRLAQTVNDLSAQWRRLAPTVNDISAQWKRLAPTVKIMPSGTMLLRNGSIWRQHDVVSVHKVFRQHHENLKREELQ